MADVYGDALEKGKRFLSEFSVPGPRKGTKLHKYGTQLVALAHREQVNIQILINPRTRSVEQCSVHTL